MQTNYNRRDKVGNMRFYKMDEVFKKTILLCISLTLVAFGLSLFFIHQVKMDGYERIKKSDYHFEEGCIKSTTLKKKTDDQDKRLNIELKNGKIIYLIEKEREDYKYPKIPNTIKENKKITYLVNKDHRAFSLKVDGKEYLPMNEVQKCEFINQLIWLVLIVATIAGGLLFAYMTIVVYKNAEESESKPRRKKARSIPEIVFLISLIPTWFLFSVDQNSAFIVKTAAKICMVWTFWILPIIIIGRFLMNPTDDYGFGGRYSKAISTICISIANICLGTFSEMNMKRSSVYISFLLGGIILIFSYWYLKNKVSKEIRFCFELVVSMYGFFFIYLLDYLHSF